MPKADRGSSGWLWLSGAIVVLLLIGSCPRDSANTELARTAREAVQLARDAQNSDRSAVLWSGRFRLLAVIVGVVVPLIVAYLIWHSVDTSEPDAAEIFHAAEKYLGTDVRTVLPEPSAPVTGAHEPLGPDPAQTTTHPPAK